MFSFPVLHPQIDADQRQKLFSIVLLWFKDEKVTSVIKVYIELPLTKVLLIQFSAQKPCLSHKSPPCIHYTAGEFLHYNYLLSLLVCSELQDCPFYFSFSSSNVWYRHYSPKRVSLNFYGRWWVRPGSLNITLWIYMSASWRWMILKLLNDIKT